MVESIDYSWTDGETFMSPRMSEWLKNFTGEQHWNHMEMEGFITKVQPEPEPDVMLTPMGLARLVLVNLIEKDSEDPDSEGPDFEKAWDACVALLKSIGLSQSDTISKLVNLHNGDESLEELLELFEERVAALREGEGQAND